ARPRPRSSASGASRAARRPNPGTTCRSPGRHRGSSSLSQPRRCVTGDRPHRPWRECSYDRSMREAREAVIVDAVRTPIGRYGGVLSTVRPDDMAARVIEAAVQRNGVSGDALDDVVFGCTNAAGEDNRNVARMASLLAGLPVEVPGATVNRLCASGLEAVRQAAHAIQAGEGDLLLAGGVESMSRSPFVMLKPERGFPRGNMALVDTTIGWRFVNPRMEERYSTEGMGETAEKVAERYGGARQLGREPLARVVSTGAAGVDPAYMGVGPVPATRQALERAGLTIDDIDLVELNEAFAAQVLACIRELDIPHEKLNVNGGAIAL